MLIQLFQHPDHYYHYNRPSQVRWYNSQRTDSRFMTRSM
ncbi:hypothetical protein BN903_7 [Halorubrum sp. AJ67]|nr:hypothetical protein BN903_7 [Halorubrum sp. AJ67]